MIELFKHLTIAVDVLTFSELGHRLRTAVRAPWSYVGDRELDFVTGGKSLLFAYRGGHLPDADLSMTWFDGEATIGNIVPKSLGQLRMSEYNQLLDDFHEKYLVPIASHMMLTIDVTKGQRDISDWLSNNARRKLEAFSSLANKGSGSSHPADHQRWLDFIVQAHIDGANLPTEVLRRWLIEELRWPDTVAADLAAEFTDGIELLERYDDLR